MGYPYQPLDFAQTRTYPLSERPNKVSHHDFATPYQPGSGFSGFWKGLPNILAGRQIRRIVEWWSEAVRSRKTVLITAGAHLIKVGLSPVLIQLLEHRAISALAFNGAGSVHDVELAMGGETSEDVAAGIQTGRFGMVSETGRFLNRGAELAADAGIGLGEALGRLIDSENLPRREDSLLWQAWRRDIPVTIHISVGSDIHHTHPETDGARMGAATFQDFRLLCGVVSTLGPGSVAINIGSAVLLPVTIEKAFSVARNHGHTVGGFLGVNLDFLQHYRANNNPVSRARELGGEGYSLTGHHELMVPLLAAALLESLASRVDP
ncbi:MAG: hypothetical protein HY319_10510 [Armatimonadetes bacterium]|nr:hypothetical protein [Armatimonadota bacterium]